MRGDKTQPLGIKILRMKAKDAEKVKAKMTPTPGPLVEPPPGLTHDQLAIWQHAVANAPREVLRNIDQRALYGWVIAVDLHQKAVEGMQGRLLVKSPTQGVPIQNPYLPMVNKQFLMMLRAASELGFTPCSRARIDQGKPPEDHIGDWDEVADAG
jgi:P27 family predicted phage terminase small subunit